MTTYVFPGQGSQVKGMGGPLFDEYPDLVKKADDILGYSIKTLCLEDPDERLNRTDYTQPALYVVNALSFLKKQAESAVTPDYLAGHSLGEYNALFAAGVFDFETGLKLVQKRGALMNQISGGGMAAIVGLNSDKVTEILVDHHLSNIGIANYNSLLQIVISGKKDEIKATEPLFISAGAILFMPLKTSGAFHSPYMKPVEDEYANFIQSFQFAAPRIPVIANLNAKPYEPDYIKSNLINQISSSVRWTQTIQYLLAKGETVFTEIGPGKVLTGLITRIQRNQ